MNEQEYVDALGELYEKSERLVKKLALWDNKAKDKNIHLYSGAIAVSIGLIILRLTAEYFDLPKGILDVWFEGPRIYDVV